MIDVYFSSCSLFFLLILLLPLLLLIRLRLLLQLEQSRPRQLHIPNQSINNLLLRQRPHKGLLVLLQIGSQIVALDVASRLALFQPTRNQLYLEAVVLDRGIGGAHGDQTVPLVDTLHLTRQSFQL